MVILRFIIIIELKIIYNLLIMNLSTIIIKLEYIDN